MEWCQIIPNTVLHNPPPHMPSLVRYIRGIRAVGIKEWWHQMQYIGDVKAGTFVGSDQCVPRSSMNVLHVVQGYLLCCVFDHDGSRIGSETVTLRISTRNKKCLVRPYALLSPRAIPLTSLQAVIVGSIFPRFVATSRGAGPEPTFFFFVA
jgi:hypothetical protein